MPNIGGPKETKRRLVASVVHSKLFYAASVWASALNNHAIQKKLFSAENSFSIPNCVDKCCVGPGERPANRLIGEGKAENLSAPQGAHLYDIPTGDRSREGSHP